VRHPQLSQYPNLSISLLRRRLVGGTAGCVLASRLAAANPDLHIVILEAGPVTYNDPAHTQPARFPSNLAPGSRTVRVHTSRPSAALGGRSVAVPCGQCLGGGGSVNCMLLNALLKKN
jgi:alcohol oxidase